MPKSIGVRQALRRKIVLSEKTDRFII
jgi:hypothetical protein